MTTKILKYTLLLALTAAMFLTCKRIHPGEGVVTIVNGSFSKATASLQFVDAKTGALVDVNGNEHIKVSIYGKNAGDVVDNLGGKNLEAGSGFLALALDEGVLPSTTAPTEFTVHATANGYLPADQQVTLVQEGHRHFTVSMVKIGDTPDRVSAKRGTLSAVPASGITTSGLTFGPAPIAATGTTASVNIPAGTKLMDKDNMPLSGNLSYTLAYFNPADNKAAANFPGGSFISRTTDNKNMLFKTFGWISMEMAATDGTEVKKFGQPIQITMSIPDGAKGLDGKPLSSGSTLQVYSYTEELAAWKYESDVVVKQNPTTAKLEAVFEMTHLSLWAVGNTDRSNLQPAYKQISVQSDCYEYLVTDNSIVVEDRLYYPGQPDLVISTKRVDIKPDQFRAYYILDRFGIYLAKYRFWRDASPSDIVEFDPSTSNTLKFPSSWCPQEPPKSFDIILTTSCPDNPTRMIRPQCFVTALEEGKSFFTDVIVLGQMTEGVLKTSTGVLKKGKKYALFAMYQGKFVALTGKLSSLDFGSVLVDGNTIDLSRPLTEAECSYLRKKTG